MKAVLIANLGHSDLQLKADIPDWGFWRTDQPDRRRYMPTEQLRQLAERMQDAESAELRALGLPFDLPLLRAYIQFIPMDEGNPQLDRIYLIGSEQRDILHAKGDTYPLAKALKKHSSILGLPPVKPYALECDPSDWSGVFDEMEKLVRAISRDIKKINDEVVVYVGLSGGTQQMNSALMIVGADVLRQEFNVKGLYVPRGAFAQPVSSIEDYRRRKEATALRALVKKYQYHTLDEYLRSNFSPDNRRTRALIELARYGSARLHSDWDAAQRQLMAIRNLFNQLDVPAQIRSHLTIWDREILNLKNDTTHGMSWLQELVWHAGVTLEQGVWWAFLVRTTTFRELALRMVAARLGVPFRHPLRDRCLPSTYVTNELRQFARVFAQQRDFKVNGVYDVNLDGEINHIVLECVCEFELQTSPNPELQQVYDFLQSLRPLVSLRNRVVHEGMAVNAEQIWAALKDQRETVFPAGAAETAAAQDPGVPEQTALNALRNLLGKLVQVTVLLGGTGPQNPQGPYADLNEVLDHMIEAWSRRE